MAIRAHASPHESCDEEGQAQGPRPSTSSSPYPYRRAATCREITRFGWQYSSDGGRCSGGEEGQAQGPRPSTHPPPVPTDGQRRAERLPASVGNIHQTGGDGARHSLIRSAIFIRRAATLREIARFARASSGYDLRSWL